ncbi:MAG: M23 family metallopeptidase [Pseudomonadota bacterium]
MNVILQTNRIGKKTSVTLNRSRLLALGVVILLVFPAAVFSLGVFVGQQNGLMLPEEMQALWNREQETHKSELLKTRQEAEDGLNALAQNVGKLQAHVMRLDALGQRLVDMANLDKGEFDFSRSPAQGGPLAVSLESVKIDDFLSAMNSLALRLDDRQAQLKVLEGLLMNRSLQAEVLPAGPPVEKGWLSSSFGIRVDPFSGKNEFHEGVDFAGKEGTKILAVAAGVVTWAGERSGYGNLVEVTHGNGYVTRYGHNSEIHVTEGQTVKKGEVLAAMGSTGRSTGPHVHFEVLRNGRPVDPIKYVTASPRQS